MRKVITGEQVAQLYNRDPFALPVWRAPVYRTPAGIILVVQLFRLLAWLVRLIARHPAGRRRRGGAGADLAERRLARPGPSWWPGSSWSWRPGGTSGRPRSPAGSPARRGASGGPGSTGAAGPG